MQKRRKESVCHLYVNFTETSITDRPGITALFGFFDPLGLSKNWDAQEIA
jgi:hypothetical protein